MTRRVDTNRCDAPGCRRSTIGGPIPESLPSPSGTRGPPATVEHLLAECPGYAEWVLAAIGEEGRSGTPTSIVDRVLGAGGPPREVRAAVHLAGQITRKVRAQLKAARRIEGELDAQDWMTGPGAALIAGLSAPCEPIGNP